METISIVVYVGVAAVSFIAGYYACYRVFKKSIDEKGSFFWSDTEGNLYREDIEDALEE